MAKSHGQEATERIAAANVGPATEAIATTVALSPTPFPKWRLGYMIRTSEVFTLIIMAAPTPWKRRATTSSGKVGVRAQNNEPAVKTATPHR